MIIAVRGTHGSGKSTLVRTVLRSYEQRTPVVEPRRRQPVAYDCTSPGMQRLVVVGPYEAEEAGGCDSLSRAETIYGLVEHNAGVANVLYEGITAQHSTGRLIALHDLDHRVVVIQLTTDRDTCVASVMARRAARGQGAFNMDNVTREMRSCETSMARLVDAGVEVELHDRASGLARVMALLADGA